MRFARIFCCWQPSQVKKMGQKNSQANTKFNGNASKKPKKTKKDNMISDNHEETLPKRRCKKMGVGKT